MDFLVLRLRGPLMSFGDVAVDELRPTDRLPGLSMMTGLLGNALGWQWSDGEKLQALQDRMILACREDQEGEPLQDYQTARLNKGDKMLSLHGDAGKRTGGFTTEYKTVQRYRHYRVDSMITALVALLDDREPTLDVLAQALMNPARPLFLGRKSCLPLCPVYQGERITASSPEEALIMTPFITGCWSRSKRTPQQCLVEWPLENGSLDDRSKEHVIERRDLKCWTTDVHGGSRQVFRDVIPFDRFCRRPIL